MLNGVCVLCLHLYCSVLIYQHVALYKYRAKASETCLLLRTDHVSLSVLRHHHTLLVLRAFSYSYADSWVLH